MNATEVSTVAEKNAVERDIGKRDIAAAVENLAAGGMGFEGAAGCMHLARAWFIRC
jgi:hypothetical protein